MIKEFHSLSCVLCGHDNLPITLAEEYYKLVETLPSFPELLKAYKIMADNHPDNIEEEVKAQLVVNDQYKHAVRAIIKLWYFGRPKGVDPLKGTLHYFHYEALIWTTLHAHPPGLTGGYYGHWAYKPELLV